MAHTDNNAALIHDIRIQFHLIHGAVQMIHAQAEGMPILAGERDITHLINVIDDACSRTNMMLNAALTQYESVEPVLLDALVEGIIHNVRLIDLGSGYTIQLVRASRPRVLVDRTRVERIISNLLTNALLHTPKNTVIRVYIGEEREEITISIQDEGPGLTSLQNSVLTASLPFAPGTETMHGLRSIRALAEEIGAGLSVEKMPPVGQRIALHLPKL